MSSPETPSTDQISTEVMSNRKAALVALLAERRPKHVFRLIVFVSIAVAIFGANFSQLPLIAKIALGTGAYLGPIAAFEVWWLRRRFEAAIELLGLSQHGSN
jgi:hypothetical protein